MSGSNIISHLPKLAFAVNKTQQMLYIHNYTTISITCLSCSVCSGPKAHTKQI